MRRARNIFKIVSVFVLCTFMMVSLSDTLYAAELINLEKYSDTKEYLLLVDTHKDDGTIRFNWDYDNRSQEDEFGYEYIVKRSKENENGYYPRVVTQQVSVKFSLPESYTNYFAPNREYISYKYYDHGNAETKESKNKLDATKFKFDYSYDIAYSGHGTVALEQGDITFGSPVIKVITDSKDMSFEDALEQKRKEFQKLAAEEEEKTD